MTIEDVIRVVKDETGRDCTAESLIDKLVDDSLEFVNLTMRVQEEFNVEITDATVAKLNTVNDLFRALSGETL